MGLTLRYRELTLHVLSVFTGTLHIYFAACFYGLYGSMYAVILIECIGQEKFQSSLGFVTMVHGFSIAIFFPVSGKWIVGLSLIA